MLRKRAAAFASTENGGPYSIIGSQVSTLSTRKYQFNYINYVRFVLSRVFFMVELQLNCLLLLMIIRFFPLLSIDFHVIDIPDRLMTLKLKPITVNMFGFDSFVILSCLTIFRSTHGRMSRCTNKNVLFWGTKHDHYVVNSFAHSSVSSERLINDEPKKINPSNIK